MMAKLAEVGFTQSYTYFTWRHDAWELREYVTELTTLAVGRLHAALLLAQHARHPRRHPAPRARPAPSRVRLVLAATLVPLYGIYSGYELGENEPASVDQHGVPGTRRSTSCGPATTTTPARWRRSSRAVNEIRRRHPGRVERCATSASTTATTSRSSSTPAATSTTTCCCASSTSTPTTPRRPACTSTSAPLGPRRRRPLPAARRAHRRALRVGRRGGYVRLDPATRQVAHLFHVTRRWHAGP